MTIEGRHIVVRNEGPPGVFPTGVVAEGTLMRHRKSGFWIIGEGPADRDADEVGGCSDGPEIVDLQKRIYWTC